mmetsp:Transcript_27367/g.83220  ORF Transcript_27367/g.83220 Transcript_27367/m.83220 type:complete len:99 (-) Transcript_27367:454-750(-)
MCALCKHVSSLLKQPNLHRGTVGRSVEAMVVPVAVDQEGGQEEGAHSQAVSETAGAKAAVPLVQLVVQVQRRARLCYRLWHVSRLSELSTVAWFAREL